MMRVVLSLSLLLLVPLGIANTTSLRQHVQSLIRQGIKLDTKVLRTVVASGDSGLVKMVLEHDKTLGLALWFEQHGIDVKHGHRLLNGNIDRRAYRHGSDVLHSRNLYDPLRTSDIEQERIIYQMLTKRQILPSARSAMFDLYIAKLTGNYYVEVNLLGVAIASGLEKEMWEMLNYLSGDEYLQMMVDALPLTKPAVGEKTTPRLSAIFLDHLAETLTDWQVASNHQKLLSRIFKFALEREHKGLIQATLNGLNKLVDYDLYRELLYGLAFANKIKDNDMIQLFLNWGVVANIDRQQLVAHASLLGGLNKYELTGNSHNSPEGRALLQAIEQDNIDAVRELIDYGLPITDWLKKQIVSKLNSVKMLELFVGREIIPLDHYGKTLLAMACSIGNLPVVEWLIAYDDKPIVLDDALASVAFAKIGPDAGSTPIAKAKGDKKKVYDRFNERKLLLMEMLVKGGADVNKTWKYGKSPLTEAIQSLQAPRVDFLLRHGAIAGDLKEAVGRAASTANLWKYSKGYRFHQFQKNLAEIKQLLVDKKLL